MLCRFPFLPGGLALIMTACAMPQPGFHRKMPIDHTMLHGEQLHTERQILEEREITLLSAFGNRVSTESRHLLVQLSSVLPAPLVDGVPLKIVKQVQQDNVLVVAYASPNGSRQGALSVIDVSDPVPVLRAELQLPSIDVTGILLDSKQIYFSGVGLESTGPLVGRISLLNYEWQDDLKVQTLDLKSVSALALAEDSLVVLDPESSQIVTLQKKDFVISGQISAPNLSQLGHDVSSIWTLSRQPAEIEELDRQLRHKRKIYSVGDLSNPLFPGQMHIGRETVMAALGAGGVRSFCKLDQRPLFTVPAVIRSDLLIEQTQSISASLSEGLLLTANADAGVYLYQVKTHDKKGACKGREVHFHGYLDLGKNFRAESLSWQNGVLSVGDSRGRLSLFSVDWDPLENDDYDFDG